MSTEKKINKVLTLAIKQPSNSKQIKYEKIKILIQIILLSTIIYIYINLINSRTLF
jgi:hypothetical protein